MYIIHDLFHDSLWTSAANRRFNLLLRQKEDVERHIYAPYIYKYSFMLPMYTSFFHSNHALQRHDKQCSVVG